MRMRALGASGLQVSELGLGCNNFAARIDGAASRAVVHAALDAGINFFDTADTYGNKGGSETLLGEILGARRKDVILGTKFASPMRAGITRENASRRYILRAIEGSLTRLRTDWIDVYWLHWPDPLTPMEETLRALDDLVHAGKVRYLGACNLNGWQTVEAQWLARELGTQHFICAQNAYNLLERAPEAELLPALAAYHLSLVPYYPLASGMLASRYRQGEAAPAGSRFADWQHLGRRYQTDANWRRVARLQGWCEAHQRTLPEVALAWLLAHREVASVIAGGSRPEQVIQNAQAIAWRMTDAERAEVGALVA